MDNAVLSMRMSAAFLLLIYTAIFLNSPGIVHHSDHDHVEHQNDTCENDPCHVAIYHPGQKGGCDHKFHFTKTPETCSWCNVILAHQLMITIECFDQQVIAYSKLTNEIVVDQPLHFSYPPSDRGPPVSFLI